MSAICPANAASAALNRTWRGSVKVVDAEPLVVVVLGVGLSLRAFVRRLRRVAAGIRVLVILLEPLPSSSFRDLSDPATSFSPSPPSPDPLRVPTGMIVCVAWPRAASAPCRGLHRVARVRGHVEPPIASPRRSESVRVWVWRAEATAWLTARSGEAEAEVEVEVDVEV
jgi:hypothetical protein